MGDGGVVSENPIFIVIDSLSSYFCIMKNFLVSSLALVASLFLFFSCGGGSSSSGSSSGRTGCAQLEDVAVVPGDGVERSGFWRVWHFADNEIEPFIHSDQVYFEYVGKKMESVLMFYVDTTGVRFENDVLTKGNVFADLPFEAAVTFSCDGVKPVSAVMTRSDSRGSYRYHIKGADAVAVWNLFLGCDDAVAMDWEDITGRKISASVSTEGLRDVQPLFVKRAQNYAKSVELSSR